MRVPGPVTHEILQQAAQTHGLRGEEKDQALVPEGPSTQYLTTLLDPPNVPLLRALWSLLDCIWGVVEGSWGVLAGPNNHNLSGFWDQSPQVLDT